MLVPRNYCFRLNSHSCVYLSARNAIGAGFLTSGAINRLGGHEYYLTPTQRKNFEAIGWADWVQCLITLVLIMISICLFLLRIINTWAAKLGMYALMASMSSSA